MSAKYPAGFLSESFARALSFEPAETVSLSAAFEKAATLRTAQSQTRSNTPRLFPG
jgi:hypothetical protein